MDVYLDPASLAVERLPSGRRVCRAEFCFGAVTAIYSLLDSGRPLIEHVWVWSDRGAKRVLVPGSAVVEEARAELLGLLRDYHGVPR